jgi:hypothetical protein
MKKYQRKTSHENDELAELRDEPFGELTEDLEDSSEARGKLSHSI